MALRLDDDWRAAPTFAQPVDVFDPGNAVKFARGEQAEHSLSRDLALLAELHEVIEQRARDTR